MFLKLQKLPLNEESTFKKLTANYILKLVKEVQNLRVIPENCDTFVELEKSISRKYIPRGCQQQYMPGLDNEENNNTTNTYSVKSLLR